MARPRAQKAQSPPPAPPPAPEAQPGGSGGQSAGTTRETRLLARAVAEDWPLTDQIRKLAVLKLTAVLANKEARPREVVAAAKALVSMGLANLASVGTSIAAETHESIKDRLADLEARVK